MFPVIEIDDSWLSYAIEQMGTKKKLWVTRDRETKYLFKYPRRDYGEAWAEKLAAEVADVMGVPHAEVELAVFQGHQGTICKSFMPPNCDLYHGNQLLHSVIPSYDMKKNIGQAQHTFHRIVGILSSTEAGWPANMEETITGASGIACFAGYLTLDALISNSDRHHENWALIYPDTRNEEGAGTVTTIELAPSFDHASSLGRELSDERRQQMLDDRAWLRRYWDRCPSRIYWNDGDSKPLHPVEVVRRAAKELPQEFREWLDISGAIRQTEIRELLNSFPPGWISETAKEFAFELIRLNQSAMETVRKEVFG